MEITSARAAHWTIHNGDITVSEACDVQISGTSRKVLSYWSKALKGGSRVSTVFVHLIGGRFRVITLYKSSSN